MARKYDVKGTKEYFYWSLGLSLLFLWALRDGWAGHLAEMGLESLVSNVIEKYPDYPGDSFYVFNRILTVLAGIAAVVCGFVHRVVR